MIIILCDARFHSQFHQCNRKLCVCVRVCVTVCSRPIIAIEFLISTFLIIKQQKKATNMAKGTEENQTGKCHIVNFRNCLEFWNAIILEVSFIHATVSFIHANKHTHSRIYEETCAFVLPCQLIFGVSLINIMCVWDLSTNNNNSNKTFQSTMPCNAPYRGKHTKTNATNIVIVSNKRLWP